MSVSSALRVGIARLHGTCPQPPKCLQIHIRRGISSKTQRQNSPVQKPAPYPYNHKRYTLLHSFFDRTSRRFDDNTKVIVVEGPVAAGKSALAKQLADELDMFYFPEANLDMEYVNDRGFDLRTLDDQLPESCKSFDVNNFLVNPRHFQSASFQLHQYAVKYNQYIDALAHVLSTGQGVVLDRCCYSDFVFLEAMFSQGYISKAARNGYYEVRKNSIGELLRPHLVIYLDVPVNKIIENVRKRGISYEKNSPVLTPEYLGVMERTYKQNYLKEIGKHAELLVYDWSEQGDSEVIIEDIERINFDGFDSQDTKMKDWDQSLEEDWGILRNKYADKKNFLLTYINVPLFDIPEYLVPGEDVEIRDRVFEAAPGEKFLKGYDPTMGDSGYFLKLGLPVRDPLPLRERRTQY